MAVRIDEARQHGAAAEIDQFGAGTLELHHVGGRADRDDPAVLDRHRLGARIGIVHGEDRTARIDDVCGFGGLR